MTLPVIVLAGESGLKKSERVKELREEFGGEYVKVFPEDPEKLDLVKSKLGNIGMFGDRVILDIIDLDSWKAKERRELFKILENVPEDVLVVLRSSEKVGTFKSENFPLPKPWDREGWRKFVREIFSEFSLDATDDVVEYFLDTVGMDEYRIRSEAEKLSLYCDGKVEVPDVDEVVRRYGGAQLDDFSFSISERDFEKAHSMIGEILQRYDPVLVVATLSKHFIDLYRIKLNVREKERYIWPDVSNVSKSLNIPVPKVARFLGFAFKGWRIRPVNHVKLYDPETIESVIKSLYVLDRYVKSSENPAVHLHDFIELFRRETDVSDTRKVVIR